MKDQNEAAPIEYTMLLGILLIAVIATVGPVGAWVSKQWLALDKALSPLIAVGANQRALSRARVDMRPQLLAITRPTASAPKRASPR